MKKDIKNKKLPDKEQKKHELSDEEMKGISGGIKISRAEVERVRKKQENLLG